MAFPTNANLVQAFAGAMYGTQIGSVTMAQVNSDIIAAGGLNKALNGYYAASFGGVATASVAATVAANLGLTGAALTEGTNYVTARLNAVAANARGEVIADILNLFKGLASDATFGAAATAWNTKVDAAAAYTAAADVAIGSVVSSTSFVLGTGLDNRTGGAGDDFFDGSLGGAAGSTATFTSIDSLNGGAGTDSLTAALAAGTTSAKLTNIENITLTSSNAGSTLDLAPSAGYTTLENAGSSNSLVFNNIANTTVALKVTNTNQDTTFTYPAALVAGAADAATVALNNVSNGGATAISIAGIETLTLNSQSGTNAVQTISDSSLKSLVVTGASNLTLGAALATTVTTVDASAATGAVSATLGAVATATVTGGAGNDTFDIASVTGNATVSAGAGNDLVVATSNLTTTDTINGGDGTDTLSTTAALAEGYTAPTTATITNMEGLRLTTAGSASTTLTTANFGATVNTVTLAGAAAVAATAGAYGVTGPTGTLTVNIGTSSSDNTADLAGALTLTDTGFGITDSAALNNNVLVANDSFAGQNVSSVGYETLTINTRGGATSANTTTQTLGTVGITADSGGTTKLVITGANSLTATTVTAGEIDASGMSGTAAFTNTGVSGTTRITGSANSDTLVLSTATVTTTVDGGAGNDTITGAGRNDVISGGDGNDSIVSGSGNDSIDGGAGNDTFDMSAAGDLTANDTIIGGAGTDTLLTTLADIQALTAAVTNVSGIETVRVGAVNGALNLSRLGAEVTTLGMTGDAAGGTISNITSGTTIQQRAANTGTLTMTTVTDTATDALTLSLSANAANVSFGTATATGVESFTISSTSQATPSVRTNSLVLDTTQGNSITVTGASALTLTTSANATRIATVNASAMTAGGLNFDGSFSAVANTITGSGFADTLIGGGGTDAISGGDGNDTIFGGSGSDTLIGGSGDDTLDGGSAADSISGGDGSDVILTSSGADTIDGGAGTDSLQVSASYANIAGVNVTSIEALDMNSVAVTMTIAQVNGFSSFTNVSGGAVLSDVGAIAANSTVAVYTLANGTNTFTAHPTATLSYGVTGGTGADTFNVTGSTLTSADTVAGGTGLDTLNITGNTAMTTTSHLNNLSAVETVVYGNSTTSISVVAVDAMNAMAATGRMTIDASNLTTGTLTFTASANEDESGFNIIGGMAGDSITLGGNGAVASVVDAGGGDDTIVGTVGTVNDTLTGGTGADTFTMAGNLAAGDIINGGAGSDTLTFTDAGGATTDLDGVTNVETITIGDADAAVVTVDALIASGSTLTVNVAAALTNRAVSFDASAETNGVLSYTLNSGSGAQTVTGGAGADTINLTTSGHTTVTGGAGADTITIAAANVIVRGGTGADTITISNVAGDKIYVLDETATHDVITSTNWATGGNDKIRISMAGIAIGNSDTTVDTGATEANAAAVTVAGELNVVQTNAGTLFTAADTSAQAAAKAAAVTNLAFAGNVAAGTTKILAFDDGTNTAVFKFVSAAADTTITAAELTLVGIVMGVAATAHGDFAFIA